jgi:hypothetical protein
MLWVTWTITFFKKNPMNTGRKILEVVSIRGARDTQKMIMCKLMINSLHKNGKTLS